MIKFIIAIAVILSINLPANSKFKKACDNRVARGCYYLDFVFLRGGKGVEQSNKKATIAFARGCDIGSERLCVEYRKLKAKGL